MYLISLYFDDYTNRTIQQYIEQVARRTGNTFMTEGEVPPHITLLAVEGRDETLLLKKVEEAVVGVRAGEISWVSVGTFLPHVLFLQPVLNAYLRNLMETLYQAVVSIEDIKISGMYQPDSWLPHTTVGKTLTEEQMRRGFEGLQERFAPFQGCIQKIGLAKTNPYRDVAVWELQ